MPVKRINLLNALHLVSVFGSAKYLLRCLVFDSYESGYEDSNNSGAEDGEDLDGLNFGDLDFGDLDFGDLGFSKRNVKKKW